MANSGFGIDSEARLYINPAKIDQEVEQHLEGVRLLPYEGIFADLSALKSEKKVLS